ncbi:MAG TPA: hypothetical protein DCP63_00365 [Bacteroidetes bacterium]|nr:hypothetical protein [Bacteroidota bacterium]
MVPILVLLTVIIFVTIGLILSGRRETKPRTSIEEIRVTIPPQVIEQYLHPGHSWVLVKNGDAVAVGIDDFAQQFVGRLDAVELPVVGTIVQQGGSLATLEHAGRSVDAVAPVSGTVVEVNVMLQKNPGLINKSPYEGGWIARVRPSNLRVELRNLLRGVAADRWREAMRMQLFQWFAPSAGPVLQDGGRLAENFNDKLSDEEWERLARECFPLWTSSRQLNERGSSKTES